MTSIPVHSVDDVREAVGGHHRVRVRGRGTKTALSGPRPDVPTLDLAGLSGLVEYDPGEFTFTALAGTPLRDVEAQLAGHGQALPFDPPLVEAGATLGGTVAAGLSGSGRYRYGGVRDFILGVRFVDGQGRLVRGGGKVVKNAAGLDLPKLMVGSLGRLGILVELTFKVFPRPEARATWRCPAADIEAAVALVRRLGALSWDVEALDILVTDRAAPRVDVRLGGLGGALAERLARLRDTLGAGEALAGDAEAGAWAAAGEFAWVPAGASLVKVPVTPARIGRLEAALVDGSPARRYVAGGQAAWVAWAGPIDRLDARLRELGLAGLVVRSDTGLESPLLGIPAGGLFATRVKAAMDPGNRFGPWERA